MILSKVLCSATALAVACAPLAAAAAESMAAVETAEAKAARIAEEKKLGSLYLRCDGQPNNVTGMESFGRLIGAVTLLALFAPQPESPDPSKRLFGEKGVDACSKLLDDPKQETNSLRRLPLIIARAIHQIEAKDYAKALSDIDKARSESRAIGLIGNPYFDRSMGLSLDAVAAEARLRQDDPQAAADAQHIAARSMAAMRFSFFSQILATPFLELNKSLPPEVEASLDAQSRMHPGIMYRYADRLEEDGRFADAAAKRMAIAELNDSIDPEVTDSYPHAVAALSYALAGNWEKGDEQSKFARANMDKRRSDGKPEDAAAKTVEVLDLFDIVKLAKEGNLKDARRSFAARSQWVTPSFGAVSEVNRRLRAGATPDELFGALKRTPDQMWQDRRDAEMAERLQKDTNNKTLFVKLTSYAQVGEYEATSKEVWRTEKSRMMGKEPDKKNGFSTVFSWAGYPVRFDAMMLHAALQAKAQGKQGFEIILGIKSNAPSLVRFANRDDKGVSPELFIDASAVIDELGKLIPSPADLEARRKAQKR